MLFLLSSINFSQVNKLNIVITVLSNILPNASTSLIANGSLGKITLINYAISGATSYNIYRSTSINPTTLLTNTQLTTYIDTPLSAGTLYYYRIKAVNNNGVSNYSNNAYDTSGNYNGTELITNSINRTMEVGTEKIVGNLGFEIFTGTPDDGTTDDWTEYLESGTSGSINDATVSKHSGNYAMKLIYVTGVNSTRNYGTTLTPLKRYKYSFWSRGDLYKSLKYNVRDNANATYLISDSTKNRSTTYTKTTYEFTTAANFTSMLWYWGTNGSVAQSVYVDDISCKEIPIYLGNGNHSVDTSSIYKQAGSYSFKIVSTGVGNGTTNTISLSNSQFTAVTNGLHYRFKIYAFTTTANTTLTFKLGDIVLTKSVSTIGLTEINYDFVATASTTGNLFLYSNQSAPIWFDEISVKSGQ